MKINIFEKISVLSRNKVKILYIGIFTFLLLVSIYHLVYANKIIPGVYIGKVSLGGRDYRDAYNVLSKNIDELPKEIKLSYGDKFFLISPEELFLDYEIDSTVEKAFKIGRTGDVFVDSKQKLVSLIKGIRLETSYDLQNDELSNLIARIQGEINNFAKDAQFVIVDGTLKIEDEKVGMKLEEEKLYNTLLNKFGSLDYAQLELPIEVDEPKVYTENLEGLTDDAQAIVFAPLKLTYDKDTWSISPDKKLEFLVYEKDKDYLGFDQVKFKTFLEPIAGVINELPRASVNTDGEGRVLSMELTKPGLEVVVDETTEKFKEAYFGKLASSEIITKKVDGPLNVNDYGIFALLGEGSSKFIGSASGRIKNLTLSANRADGVLVPPGAVFSLNEAIGPITAETGYDAAWVILGNRTVLGHGGGVCQTSTTLFRALLNSGLPIVERNPHAYRVYYYEIESPMGMDASIYQPSLDLKFKNDTAGYILVTSEVRPEEFAMTFRLYGTPDGRKVELSEPVVASQTPAPAPLYQDDPTLPKGVVRQIDFAASGATVSFTRKVIKGDEVLYNDVFKTNYQPWRAVYLKGTKE